MQASIVVGKEKQKRPSVSERRTAWQARVKKSREDYLARVEAARDKQEKRIAALRIAKDGNSRTSSRKGHFNSLSRSEEDGVYTFVTYKRRDNKPAPVAKKTVNPQIKAPAVAPKGKYGALIAKYAKQHGVPYSLARAVVQVESSFRANVTGAAGEIGLMQIKLATARRMGYKGSRKQLYNPATNLYWGMKYLGRAYQLAGGSTCGTILKYNAGHGAKRMNKISSRYCGRVKRILA